MNNVLLPPALIQSLIAVKGFDEQQFLEAHQIPAITSIRINPSKYSGHLAIETGPLDIHQSIPWSSYGYYLSERPSFTLDPLFHAGAYYVQEASSMFLEQALKQSIDLNQPLKVLDLCAAPGGKSTLIQSLISNESLLVSNELIKQRVNILTENIIKWSADNVVVTNNEAKDFQRLEGFFDVIVVDAPCSGSGLFRKDENAIDEWSPQNVMLCSQRQQRILADVLPALQPGGILIYSTCSYSEAEDESIADWILEHAGMQSLQLKTEAGWNIVETQSVERKAYGYRFYPDKLKGEGFYTAVFKNNGERDLESFQKPRKNKLPKISAIEMGILISKIKNTEDRFFFKWMNSIYLTNKMTYDLLSLLMEKLYIKNAGIELGEIIRDDFIPAHALAVSKYVNADATTIEADKETILNYLRRKDIYIDTEKPGWALLTYKDLGIGWVKILKNRINNYYPKDWRILNK
jgi:16S rRNA C967 or C1407 C5-methylase (RsmB/RsmF family)/NOL1/NOP2/fmu family ribosome biogenesis protein